ncbi:hypothetical protein K435DRAFT_775137 [Dendrothele bispora CBS 962.96]|uniref:Uncharacterized protein n=1 Tax=Dendrothele bispora (strain CBS 962.96) TaxID=1314807 RepID=A0A4S8MJW9_DENBC|nr:hypothetical protein K435DRAFT_775137 [Dendrothele bispora CBS 962.96]
MSRILPITAAMSSPTPFHLTAANSLDNLKAAPTPESAYRFPRCFQSPAGSASNPLT